MGVFTDSVWFVGIKTDIDVKLQKVKGLTLQTLCARDADEESFTVYVPDERFLCLRMDDGRHVPWVKKMLNRQPAKTIHQSFFSNAIFVEPHVMLTMLLNNFKSIAESDADFTLLGYFFDHDTLSSWANKTLSEEVA